MTELQAGALVATIEGDRIRLGTTDHPDWFGPATPARRGLAGALGDSAGISIGVSTTAGVDGVLLVTLTAIDDIDDQATGEFDRPSTGLAFDPADRRPGGLPGGAVAMGHQYMEFALPTTAKAADLDDWLRWPFRPAVVQPLWIADDDAGVIFLGPIDAPFDQVIAVPRDTSDDVRTVRWGWHGDLASIPAGTSATLAVIHADSVSDAMATWTGLVAERLGRAAPRRHDVLGSHLSYWTDNGSAYWYRTEGDRTVTETLSATLADLRASDVSVHAVQLDSWFYPHAVIRPFDTDEWVVPPTGLIDWEARHDILPGGVATLRAELGNPPLVTHCRHLSSASPLVQRFDCWIDVGTAHPTDPDAYYGLLADRASSWGVQVFEHDWLIECFLAVRGLRERPGRAEEWQRAMDRVLIDRGMTAQWCMGSPADMVMASTLDVVTSVRTSGDTGYMLGPHALWAWFAITSALARSLGLTPFTDVFRTADVVSPHQARVAALLAVLSTGPVGIGDRLGATDVNLVRSTCRADGLIVSPDVPLAAVDRSLRRHPFTSAVLLVAATHIDHDPGRWSHVVTLNCTEPAGRLDGVISVSDLGVDAPTAVTGRAVVVDLLAAPDSPDSVLEGPVDGLSWPVSLEHQGLDHRVVVPVSAGGHAVIGDLDLLCPSGRNRVRSVVEGPGGSLLVRVLGVPGESVRLGGWTRGTGRWERRVSIDATGDSEVRID